MYKIWIVEDDEIIASKMKQYLMSWGYDCEIISDFYHVIDEFKAYSPHLVLMDITLPYLNGYIWTEEIRKLSKVPIVFVSSANENMNIVMAISKGADDYITKPFDLTLLAAKLQAILRRTYDFSDNSNILEHKGIRFCLDDNMVYYKEQSIELTKNEAKILRLLMEKKDHIVSRDELMDYLWNTDFYVDENALSVNVNRLRKKLGGIGVSDFIETKKGLGYKV